FVSKQNTAYELETCMEFRRVLFRSTLHPPVHRAVINRHTAFGEHLLDVAVAEPVAAVPPHRPQNDVLREVSTREDTHNPTCCQPAISTPSLQQHLHMQHHGHSAGAVGAVIAVHIASMYLPSPLSGFLVDRYGRMPIAGASGLTLLAAGVVAAFAPPQSVVLLAIALGLLGLGWSLGLVSGTAIITDNT